MLAVAGVALLVSLFLPWYGESGGSGSLTGWEALAVIDVILALIAACAISVTVATTIMRVAAVPIALDAIATLLGLLALVLVLIRVLDLPDGATGREMGLWIALAGAAGVFVGGGVVDARRAPVARGQLHRRHRAPGSQAAGDRAVPRPAAAAAAS